MSDNVRIAYVTTHYPSISHTFIQGEITALRELGMTISPVALNPASDRDVLTEADTAARAETFYIKAHRARRLLALAGITLRHPTHVARGVARAARIGGADLRGGWKATLHFLEGMILWRHCRQRSISSIHAHFGQAPAAVAGAAAAFGNDVGRGRWTWSVTIHGWHEFATEDTAHLSHTVDNADLVVAISSFTRSQLLRVGDPRRWDNVQVARCGIDRAAFPQRAERPVRAVPRIVITGRLSPEKGHLVLFEAVRLLHEAGFPVTVHVVGSGAFEVALRDAAVRLGIDDHVVLLGALPPAAVALELQEADIFCLPSFAEGLPVSIMEAMAVGVPVVTTYIAGIPELVVDGATGWVVPAGDAVRLAEAIRASATSDRRTEIVHAARCAVTERHDRSVNIRQLEALLRSCHGEVMS